LKYKELIKVFDIDFPYRCREKIK